MPDRVLLTGISGFLGGHVALALLHAGYRVRGSVRTLGKAEKVRHTLKTAGADLDRLDIVALDLMDDHGWTEAAHGCRYLQHVASPFLLQMPADRQELIAPAVEGTRRALEAGLDAGVERIVLTSSMAAVQYGHPPRTEPFTDADWSRTEGADVTPYSESKTRAELEAWSIMEAAGRRHDLVSINPSVILGPMLDEDPGTSGVLIKRLLDGSVPVAPRFSFGVVDVRDIAALHVAAMQSPEAGGHRFLASAASASLLDLATMLRSAFPTHAGRLPRFELPDWLTRLYALLDADARGNLAFLGVTRTLDTSRAADLLGRPFISARLAAMATAKSLIEHGLV